VVPSELLTFCAEMALREAFSPIPLTGSDLYSYEAVSRVPLPIDGGAPYRIEVSFLFSGF